MVVWIIILTVLTILSYVSDVGIFVFLQDLRVPGLNASIMSILILLCTLAMLGRVLWKIKTREKEALGRKITELMAELKALKEKGE